MTPVRLLSVCLLLFMVGNGCTDSSSSETADAPLEVEDFAYRQLPGGARVLTGKLYNPTEHAVPNAQLQVSLFDETNRRISSMTIVVRDIAPGERKDFREAVDSNLDIHAARVRSVLLM